MILNHAAFSQILNGVVIAHNKESLPGASILIKGSLDGTSSNLSGEYTINMPSNKSVIITVSFLGFQTENIRVPMLKKGQTYSLDIQLTPENKMIADVIVTDKKSRKEAFNRIKIKHVSLIPSGNKGVESILKTLPGVSSANELSAQYSVRGGNFDENLVYVNGIEIYRPFLIRSGQQEGLSFINTDLVSNIQFSSGGFAARYGDKMSSVLDITYKDPYKNKASLLGGSAHFEGIGLKNKLSYLLGARHKTNQYILKAMDTKGEYKPHFSDIQTFLKYQIKENWDISFLGSISENRYRMVPQNRETEFGTLNEALKLTIYFEGQESDKYNTYFGALSTNISPNLKTKLNFTSLYRINIS